MMTYRDKTIVFKDKRVVQKTKLLRTAALAIFAVVALTGCGNDEFHNTPHPDKGAVRITTDWSGLSEDATDLRNHVSDLHFKLMALTFIPFEQNIVKTN